MIQGDAPIRELLENNYRLAGVLFQNGVDIFKCMDLTVQEACNRLRIDSGKLLLRINYTLGAAEQPVQPDFTAFSCGHLILYLIHTHHAHSRVTLPMIHYHIKKNEQLHGGEFPHLMMLNTFFDKFRSDFMYHLRQEEEIIFPYIHQLEEALTEGSNQKLLELPDISIQTLNARHMTDNEDIEDISRLTNHFRHEAADPLPFRILMRELEDLYNNLRDHSQVEEDILFRKAEEMEKAASTRIHRLLGLN